MPKPAAPDGGFMGKRIELKGAGVTLSGNFTGWTQHTLAEALKQQGARVYKKRLSPNTDLVVAGARTEDLVQRARMAGVPVVSEEALETLLATGVLELSDEEASQQPVDGVLSDLRSLLHGQEGPELWPKVIAFVDQAEEGVAPVVVDYVHSHLARWESQQMAEALWTPYSSTGAAWLPILHQPALGHWRVAPLPWLIAMSRGEDHVKYRLVAGLSLGGTQLSTRMNRTVVMRPDLVNVQALYMGGGCKYTVALMTHIAQSGQYASLTHLWLNSSGPRANHLRPFMGDVVLPNLTRLTFAWHYLDRAFPAERLEAIVACDGLQQITTLETSGYSDRLLLTLLGDPNRFPHVERIIIGDQVTQINDTLRDLSPILDRPHIKELGFVHMGTLRAYAEAMHDSRALPQLDCIDLRRLTLAYPPITPVDIEKVLQTGLLQQAGSVRLGALGDDPMWHTPLRAAGVTVVRS
ncbi:MAG: hypothetical protein AAFX99_25665 [Myxococcota bacterium]